MPVDSSIYFQQQAPDFLGSFQQGMNLRDAFDKRALQQKQLKEDEAIKSAFKTATSLGPNGELNFNQGMALGEIAKANPMKAFEYKQQFAAQDAANLQKKREQMGFVSSLAGTIKDQASLNSALAQAKQYGIPVDGLPTVYDQSTAPVFQRIQLSALTAQQQLENQFKQTEEARKAQESAANLAKTKAETAKINTEIRSGKGGQSEGIKAVDKDYAKDYNDFTGGGEAKALQGIAKLKEYRDKLKKDNGLFQAGGGPISGSMPDAFRTQNSIAQRDNIISAANATLKATFGGQLSDGERKAASNEYYNDRLDNEQNVAILDRKIGELEQNLKVQQAKANYFRNNRTLDGFGQPQQSSQQGPAKMAGISGAPILKTSEIEW